MMTRRHLLLFAVLAFAITWSGSVAMGDTDTWSCTSQPECPYQANCNGDFYQRSCVCKIQCFNRDPEHPGGIVPAGQAICGDLDCEVDP